MAKYDYGISIKGVLDLKQLKEEVKKHTLTIDFKISAEANKEIKRLERLAQNLKDAFAGINKAVKVSSNVGGVDNTTGLTNLELARREKARQTLISQIENRLNIGERSKLFEISNKKYSGEDLKKNYEELLKYAHNLNISANDYKTKLTEAQTELVKLNPAYQSLQKEAQKTLDKTDSFAQVFAKKLLNALAYRLIFTVFNSIIKAANSLYKTTLDIDKELVNINKVLELTNNQMKDLVNNANELANAYARTTVEVMRAVGYFAKAGFGYEQSLGLAELSLRLQNVGDLTSDAASQFLIAVNAAYQFNGSLQELSKTIDIVNNLSNNAAVTVEFLSEAMKVSGSVAYSAGLSFEEYASLLTTIGEVTQRSGREVGNGLRTIILRLTQVTDSTGEMEDNISKVESILRKVGIELRETPNTFRPAVEILTELSNKWEKLTDLEKREITYNLAGVYRSNILEALLANMNKYEESLYIALNSIGSATRENELYMNSLEAGIKKITVAWEKFVVKFKSSFFIKTGLSAVAFAVRNIDIVMMTLAAVALPLFIKAVSKAIISIKSFVATLKGWQIALDLIVVAVTLLVSVIREAGEAQRQFVEKSNAQIQQLIGNYGQLNIIIRQYQQLKEQYDKTGQGVEELKDIQEQLIAQFGRQAGAIDLVNGKYEDQIKLLQNLSEKQLVEIIEKNETAARKAQEYMNSAINADKWGIRTGGRAANALRSLNTLEQIAKYRNDLNLDNEFLRRIGLTSDIISALGLDATPWRRVSGSHWGEYEISRSSMIKYLEYARNELNKEISKHNKNSATYKELDKTLNYIEKGLNALYDDTQSYVELLDNQRQVYQNLAKMRVSGSVASKLQGSENTIFDLVFGYTEPEEYSRKGLEEYQKQLERIIDIIDGINADNVEDKLTALYGLIPNLDIDRDSLLKYITNEYTQLQDTIARLLTPLGTLEKQVKQMEALEKAERSIYDLRRSIADAGGLTGEDYANFVTGGDGGLLSNEKYAELSREITQLYEKYREDIAKSEAEGLNNQETITQLFETQLKLKEKQLKVVQKELEIQEKMKSLNRLENERTQAVFIGGQRVWVQDYEAIAKQREEITKQQQELDRLRSEYETELGLSEQERNRLNLRDSIEELNLALKGENGVVEGLTEFAKKIGEAGTDINDSVEEFVNRMGILDESLVSTLKSGLVKLFELAGIKDIESDARKTTSPVIKNAEDFKNEMINLSKGNNVTINEVIVNNPSNFNELVKEIRRVAVRGVVEYSAN